MNGPNIFNFATSELSQDAVLAYIIAWADPKYKTEWPVLNKLGVTFIRKLAGAWAETAKVPNPLEESEITNLEVGTQKNKIDVWAKVNDKYLLLIEDKTYTAEHSNQIMRYVQEVNDIWSGCIPIPVYVKTGNECCPNPGGNLPCGIYMRGKILAVLDNFVDINNTIINEFKEHLYDIQTKTNSYYDVDCKDWSYLAIESFYMELYKWLKEEIECNYASWDYIPNQRGGFIGMWWNWKKIPSLECEIYLQVEDGYNLKLRADSVYKDDTGEPIKIKTELLNKVVELVKETFSSNKYGDMNVAKVRHLRPVRYSSVVDITFGEESDSYLAINKQNKLDMDLTKTRLLRAMKFLEDVCKAANK